MWHSIGGVQVITSIVVAPKNCFVYQQPDTQEVRRLHFFRGKYHSPRTVSELFTILLPETTRELFLYLLLEAEKEVLRRRILTNQLNQMTEEAMRGEVQKLFVYLTEQFMSDLKCWTEEENGARQHVDGVYLPHYFRSRTGSFRYLQQMVGHHSGKRLVSQGEKYSPSDIDDWLYVHYRRFYDSYYSPFTDEPTAFFCSGENPGERADNFYMGLRDFESRLPHWTCFKRL